MSEKKRNSGPRSNLTYHSSSIRERVYQLLLDGYTTKQINADPIVAESIKKTGKRLHPNTLTSVKRKSPEYFAYCASHSGMTPILRKLFEHINRLSPYEQLECLAMVIANFPEKIKEETRK